MARVGIFAWSDSRMIFAVQGSWVLSWVSVSVVSTWDLTPRCCRVVADGDRFVGVRVIPALSKVQYVDILILLVMVSR